MKVIADLEVHSKYARAVSPSMDVQTIAEWAAKKGIGLVGTGDFTHPVWLRELKAGLEEYKQGIYRLKDVQRRSALSKVNFLLTSEVSCVYSHNDKTRKVHLMVYFPTFSSVEGFNSQLVQRGAKLLSDGRPIIGLSLRQVAEVALDVDSRAIIIPAHVWTPWFGFYGDKGGYESLDEAFGDLAPQIRAVETGLSSDPVMNWRMSELENRRIVSFGDAHSPQKLGREATVFDLKDITYNNVYQAIMGDEDEDGNNNNHSEIAYTIEFYPEEGKYHFTGHRKCKVVYSSNEARKKGMVCPVCGKKLTVGVTSRVESLGKQDVELETEMDELGLRWIKPKKRSDEEKDIRKPFIMLVPLAEIIAEARGVGVGTKTVNVEYEQLIAEYNSEFNILLNTKLDEMGDWVDARTIEGIKKVRSGDINIEPGYDGVFGKVKIWADTEEKETELADQEVLFET